LYLVDLHNDTELVCVLKPIRKIRFYEKNTSSTPRQIPAAFIGAGRSRHPGGRE
jgi:hypothetical protein